MNPVTAEAEGSEQQELYDQLRKFYLVHDKSKLNQGIGNVVEWTLEHGVENLNKILFERYGGDLNTIQEAKAVKAEASRSHRPLTKLTSKRDIISRLSQVCIL